MLRIDLTVADLPRAERFYRERLGFIPGARTHPGPALARLLGVDRIGQVVLHRGQQAIALQCMHPQGAPYPQDAGAADQAFQHFAMPVRDIGAAYALVADCQPVSRDGPQALPQRSGGVIAYKFRDPDGHPLELIQFPDHREGGIDHSAIAVSDASRSIAFYASQLGLAVSARQVNTGPEQDRLDGLHAAQVDVVALQGAPGPHVELLAYRSPALRTRPPARPHDIAATRLLFGDAQAPPNPTTLLADPDGHLLLR